MSYIVLARKWRPQRFEEVVGQKPIVQTLQNAIRSNRVAHAFLFTGPRGVGKTSVARILAKALNCVHGPTPFPCNECDACQEITKTIAPDVFEIDGASNTGVDHVRDLQETIKYLPQKHRYKIFIVDEVHMLSTPAFNAFLKTLEEPPSHVIFIFATTEPHKIIDTVIDRCQRYDFKRIPSELIHQKLREIVEEEHITISPNSLQLIAREAEGSLRDAQSMLDQIVTYAGKEVRDEDVTAVLGVVDSKILFEVSSAVLKGDLRKCLEVIENIFNYGIDTRQFYRGLMEHFRNLMVAKVNTHSQLFPDLSHHEVAELAQQSQEVSLEKLQIFLKVLIESEGYIYRAPLPRIILEAILLKMAVLPPASSFKEILDKLASLQEKLGRIKAQHNELAEYSQEFIEPGLVAQEKAPPLCSAPSGISREKTWKVLLDFIRTKKPLLASILEHGTLLRNDQENLDIGFLKNSLFLESIQEASKKRELSEICEDFFGKKIKVNIQVITHLANDSEEQKSILTKPQEVEKIREEARNHPLIKEALRIFGGGITEIKILNP